MLRILAIGPALIIAMVVLLPTAILPAIAPDASASRDIARILPDAKRTLNASLNAPFAYVRYIGMEARAPDRLVILQFEIRPWPYLGREGAYLASRCTSLPELDPADMSAGIGVRDFAADTELAYLRSDAQPPCP